MGKGNMADMFLLECNAKIASALCKFSTVVKKVKTTLIKFTEPKKGEDPGGET